MFRRSSSLFLNSVNTTSSSQQRVEKPFDRRGLKYLRTYFGNYSKVPCKFRGSPAVPFGSSYEVRYESLDVVLPKKKNIESTNNKNNNSDISGKYLHRIHHIAGFISSLYVAEYRTTTDNNNDSTNSRELFLLDTGITTDVTRVEVALRHVLHGEKSDDKNDKNNNGNDDADSSKLISNQMKLVFSTHAHSDHFGAARNWVRRGVPVCSVPHLEDHFDGFWGRFQWAFEAFGANFYGWYLMRNFPEWTWVNPFWRLPQIRDKPHLFGQEAAEKIQENRLQGGDAVPIFDDWLIFQVPGHCHHMATIYNPSARIIYVADKFIHQFGKFRPPIPVDRLDCYVKSLDMIKELPVKWILTAHGGIFEIDCEDVRQQQKEQKCENENDESKKKEKEKRKKPSPFKDGESHRKGETFKQICEDVAKRAIKSASADHNTSTLVKLSRALASSSPAPKNFDWERDMRSPEEQMEKAKQHPGFREMANDDNEEMPLYQRLKHVRDYTADSSPRD